MMFPVSLQCEDEGEGASHNKMAGPQGVSKLKACMFKSIMSCLPFRTGDHDIRPVSKKVP